MLNLDLSNVLIKYDFKEYCEKAADIHNMIHNKTGRGSDFLGWLDWPANYDKDEFDRIKKAAKKIRDNSNVLLVCGIGGSYLGAKAAIEFVKGHYYKDSLEIIFVGNTFSSTEIVRVLDYIQDKEVSMNVISKSGSTTETAVAFRVFRQFLEQKYGKDAANDRIYVTTDKARGSLRPLVEKYNWESFIIPDDIGGRFSVITAVGLLPIACAGIDIDKMMAGFKAGMEEFSNPDLMNNSAYQYGLMRRLLEADNKNVELFVTYESHLSFIAEWLKQLDGESEGKEGKGLLPHSVTNSTDLHSMGQFVQEGSKCLFETVIFTKTPLADMKFPVDASNEDNMSYLENKSLHWVNQQAMLGTLKAHVETGNVPNVVITLDDNSEYTFGYMVYFFFKALAMSAYWLDVNPFDQPGVEVYKKNMFALLGKK